MARKSSYEVPNHVLSIQGKSIVQIYNDDSAEHKTLLASIGINDAKIEEIAALAAEVEALEGNQEVLKLSAEVEKKDAQQSIQAALAWRNKKVIPRARLAFSDVDKLHFFRAGKMRSQSIGPVIGEITVTVAAVERFKDDPEAIDIGINNELYLEGKKLLENLSQEHIEAASALATQKSSTDLLQLREEELSVALANLEQRAAIVFADSVNIRRYRMKEIRDYVSRMHDKGEGDATAQINVPDPAPEEPTLGA